MNSSEHDARFMRSVLAASDDCIKVLDLDGKLTFMSEGGRRVMEVSDFNAIRGCPWPAFWAGRENAHAVAAVEAACAGRSYRFQGAANTAAGNPRYWDVQVSPILGPDGQPESILSVSRDITDFKKAEEREALLRQEMAHRLKNSLALVQAIAAQTLRDGIDIAKGRDAFLARLSTMSAAQDILSQAAWEPARLGAIVAAIVAQNQPERFRALGPEVELSSKCTLAMALALHELATNAVKYGALSNDTGSVDVTWSVDGDPDARQFCFRWQESGGPAVAEPLQKGFGTRMIERALAGYFSGRVRIEYRPEGLVFVLNTSLDALKSET